MGSTAKAVEPLYTSHFNLPKKTCYTKLMIKQKLIDDIKQVLKDLGIEGVKPHIERPAEQSHGDYASNVAMVGFGKKDKKQESASHTILQSVKNPMELAEKIKRELEKRNTEYVHKIEAKYPGFLNFELSYASVISSVNQALGVSKKVTNTGKSSNKPLEMYENTQPNTNKPLHIGHLRNTTLGVSIVNLRQELGKDAWSVNINNDRGIHICKAMWGYLQYGKANQLSVLGGQLSDSGQLVGQSAGLVETDEEKTDKLISENGKLRTDNRIPRPNTFWRILLTEWVQDQATVESSSKWQTPPSVKIKPDHFVGNFYVLGDKAEKAYAEMVSGQLSEMLQAWEAADPQVRQLWKQMNEWFYAGFKQTHGRILGINPYDTVAFDQQFDKEWYESDIYQAGKQIALDNLDKGVFYRRDDGVIMADLKKYKLPDKVIVRSDGTSVYITQDLELSRQRVLEDHAALSAYVVGSEQELHFAQLFAICEELGYGTRANYMHISYGMVNLAGGLKMSSREGTVVTADELMDTMVKRIKETYKVSDEVAEKVGIGAIKYWMLKYNPKAEIAFDIDESIKLEGNSGPYIQYTYARTQSVLKKANLMLDLVHVKDMKLAVEEENLLRTLYQFSDVVQDAGEQFAPQLLCTYLFELSQKFNLFYEKHKIVGSPEEKFRVGLTNAVGKTLEKGLSLLGIAAPQRM